MRKAKRPDGWHCWQGMLRRCDYPQHVDYANYGGRGITVCERWRGSFANFMADMGPRPSKAHSIDRFPNQDGNYEPGNCRWATPKEQQNNRRNNRLLTLGSRTQTMSQWAEELGITVYALHQRLRGRMTVEEALTYQPPLIEFDGNRLSATDWAKVTGLKANTITKRIAYGWTPVKALTTPVKEKSCVI